jgi:hypothetical protein
VLGPTFERLCREWTRSHGAGALGLQRSLRVSRGLVPDAKERRTLEVDVVATGRRREICLLGEAKWGERMDIVHLEPLHRARELLAQRKFDVSNCVLACFSAAGFTQRLEVHAKSKHVLLVDLHRLYGDDARNGLPSTG